MQLQDLPVDILVSILEMLDTKELLTFAAAAAPYSSQVYFALQQVHLKPIVLKVETLTGENNHLESSKDFDGLTLVHASSNRSNIPYEESSNLFFDTFKYFKNLKPRYITLQFELNTDDDMSCIKDLLIKCEELLPYNFEFQLSIFKNLSQTKFSKYNLPYQELKKFNWSRVTIDTNYFEKEESKIIQIEQLNIQEDSLNDFYFPKLGQVKFDAADT
ncbi:hypothetical protein DFJ63DRAFT_334919 [Scheffersomyces coipomensis]|uniref:uncharacterized protein n=1 Tax=Scheffersomyces coipomensis TaxID=1788519 RepID=UPI00315CC7BD